MLRLAPACTLALLLVPTLARAHALEPRTGVVWTDAPCLTTFDRSIEGPILALHYDIPKEDATLTENEPPDGRRHQFFAFCRDHYLEDRAPNWITMADLEVALELGLGDLSLVDLEHDVLEQAAAWQGCWSRITEDDERRPITFEAAAEPVAWDTSTLPAGAYVVEAYTWDPWFNLWTEHPGVIRIVDDPDPAANPPAAALVYAEQVVEVDEPAQITGCVDAMPGSTMTLAWALAGTGVAPRWQVFAEDLPVESRGFAAELPGPEAASGRYLLVAATITDPLGRTWTAHAREYIGVIATVPGEGDSGGSDSGESSGTEGGSTDIGESGDPGMSEAGGCGCSTDSPVPLASLAGLLLVIRRRRSVRSVVGPA